MESIGKQFRLPINTAFQISMQGIKIRLGRALVTISGVVLGIAFLMSIFTGNLITRAVEKEQTRRNKVKVMMTAVEDSLGVVEGKTIAIAVIGSKLSDYERIFLQELGAAKPGAVRAYHLDAVGVTLACKTVPVSDIATLGEKSDLLILLGEEKQCATPFATLTKGMLQSAVIDSNTDRIFAGQPAVRDFFFGSEAKAQERDEMIKAAEEQKRNNWVVVISLLVTVIGIANALLMSVTERFKEIGTMKCLGALSGFIFQLFLIESLFIGLVGSLLGIVIGVLFPLAAYSFVYNPSLIIGSLDMVSLGTCSLRCLGIGSVLSVIAAIGPANFAARMIPAMALRSNV